MKVPFFDPKLLEKSEFIYRNRLIQLKETDIAMMNDASKQQEEEIAKKIAAEKASSQPVAAAPGKKADPKAAAAKGAKDKGKGAAVTDDPNQPKDLTIEYPDVPALPDFVIIDRTYRQMKFNANPPVKNEKPDPTVDKKAVRLKFL